MELAGEFYYIPDDSSICTIKSAQITSPESVIEGIVGNHKPGKNHGNVTKVFFQNLVVHYFPRGLHKIFPNLREIYIIHCGLKSITRCDLEGLENVTDLCLSENQLKMLPDDLFVGMKNLKKVSFAHNKLESLSSKLLLPLLKGEAEWVDFQGNVNINAFYSKRETEGTESLEELMAMIDSKCIQPQQPAIRKFVHLNLENAWDSKSFSDFAIKVGSKIFEVHRIVLGTHSSVFTAMFQNDFKEKSQGEAEIEGFSAEGVEDFLKCLYTGEIQEVNAMEVFALASKYNVQNLREDCEFIVLKNIDEENALEVFNLGHLYNSKALKEAAFEKIKTSFGDIELNEDLVEDPEKLKNIVNAMQQREQEIKEADQEKLLKLQEMEEIYKKKIKEAEKQKSDAKDTKIATAIKIDQQKAQKIDKAEKTFQKILQQFN